MGDARGGLELPFERTWWIEPGRVIGGRFPGTPRADESEAMLARLLDVGVRTVINLQQAEEVGGGGKPFPDYSVALRRLAHERGMDVRTHRFPAPDMGVPSAGQMGQIMAVIDAGLGAGHRVYVHCWGGHGRTGTVAGCWLVRGGMSCDAALGAIASARRHDAHLVTFPAPMSVEQHQFVRNWKPAPRSRL